MNINKTVCLIALISLILLIAPLAFSGDVANFLTFFFLYSAMSHMLNLLIGYTGMINLGFHGFIGLGGYMFAISCTIWGLNPLVSFLFSGAVCSLIAAAASFLIYKIRGLYFALGTIILASAFNAWFEIWTYTGGGYGMPVTAFIDPIIFYYGGLVITAISLFIVYLFIRAPKLRLKLVAIADDDMAAEVCGVAVFRTKFYCWVISSFMAGIIGSLWFSSFGYITPKSAFSISWTLIALTSLVIGGSRTLVGPIIGAFIITLIRQFFIVILPHVAPLLYGAILVIVLFLFPKGVWGYIEPIIKRLLS
ncbi:MAG: branched-chain amino acid ABC transporter permease [Candidatus Bathyarchaeia archaeon]